MILARELAIGLLDVVLTGGFGNAEDIVIVSKLDRHASQFLVSGSWFRVDRISGLGVPTLGAKLET
jgi:hypothetical protein